MISLLYESVVDNLVVKKYTYLFTNNGNNDYSTRAETHEHIPYNIQNK